MYIIYNILKYPSFDFFNALIVSVGLSIFGVYEKFLILSTFFWIYSNYNPTFLLNRINRFNVIKKSFKLIDNDDLYKTNKIIYYINYGEDKLNKTVNYIDNFIDININIFNKLRISTKINELYLVLNNTIDIYIHKFLNIMINIYNNLVYNIVDTSKKNKFTIIKKEMEEFKKLKEELDNDTKKELSDNLNDIDVTDTSIDTNMKEVENLLNEINNINVQTNDELDDKLDDKLNDNLDNTKINQKNNIINNNLEFFKNIDFDKMMKEIIYLKDNKLNTQMKDLIKKDN
jgi:hypothetical protein